MVSLMEKEEIPNTGHIWGWRGVGGDELCSGCFEYEVSVGVQKEMPGPQVSKKL